MAASTERVPSFETRPSGAPQDDAGEAARSPPQRDCTSFRNCRGGATGETELAQLIEPGRVHRRVYTDPAIFELEMARIFGAAWIYVGHESQVKNPGDYFCTR